MKKSRFIIAALFAAAGFSALVFQVVWQRELSIVFGGALQSTAVILSSTMAGLALGAWFFGKKSATAVNKLRFFGFLQIALGVVGLILIFIAPAFEQISKVTFPLFISNEALYHVITALLAFFILLVPTTLVGGSFPVIIAAMNDIAHDEPDTVSRLYALNNVGSVAGAVLCGFIFIRFFGSTGSAYVAAGVAILSGLYACTLKFSSKAKGIEVKADSLVDDIPAEHSSITRSVMIILFVVSGFTSLSYELLYNRTVTYFVGNNTFSFSILVSVFILGLSIGSFLFSRQQRRISKRSTLLLLFGAGQILIAFLHVMMPLWSSPLNSALVNARFSLGYESMAVFYLMKITGALCVVLLPAVIFGFLYPLVFRFIFSGGQHISAVGAGRLSALNTAGTAVGPLVTGFIIVAFFGIAGSLRLNATLSFAIGAMAFLLYFSVVASSRLLRLAAVVPAGIVLILSVTVGSDSGLGRTAALASSEDELLYYREGVFGTVSVSRTTEGVKEIKINGVGEVPTDHDSMRAFRMLAHLPFAIHPDPKSVVSIAFGGGITFGSIAEHKLSRTVCVEICKDVLDAAPLYETENHGVYKNKEVKIYINDGRKFVSSAKEKFDLITSDSTHPASYDSWILYTKEFYHACHERLNPNGIFAQWVPLHDLSVTDFKTILKTYSSQFTHASLVLTNTYTVILGSDAPLEMKQEYFARMVQNPVIAKELSAVAIYSVEDLKKCVLMGDDALRAYAADGIVATDGKTPLQFTELRSFSRNTISDNMKSFAAYIDKTNTTASQSFLRDYLSLQTMYEDGDHQRLLATFNEMKTPDIELYLVAKKSFDTKKKELLSKENLSLILSQDDPEKSLGMVSELESLFPDEGILKSVKGYVVFHAYGDKDAAEKLFDEAVRLSPDQASVLNNAAKFYFSAGQYEKALNVLTRLDTMNPGNDGVVYSMAVSLQKLNRGAEAERIIAEQRMHSGNNSFGADLLGGR